MISLLGKVISGGVVLLYGSFWLFVAGVYTLLHVETWTGQSSEDKALLKQASHDLWSLSNSTGPISHHFLRIPNGVQFHYLSPSAAPRSVEALIIFLHGFPDSSHIWARQLRAASPQAVKLVALDLPGCGGSDGLTTYGPDQVLNALAEAILALRRLHLGDSSQKQCILVAHDWGGAVAFRLAAETRGLFDRMVVLNSVYPRHAEAVFRARLGRARRSFASWLANPIDTAKLRDTNDDLYPVLRQVILSNYIFLLIFPIPIARLFPRVFLCLVRFCHRTASRGLPPAGPREAATSLAMSCGPTVLECATHTATGQAYGPSVLKRAETSMPGDWDERSALYRDGLGMNDWVPSYTGYSTEPPSTATSTAQDAIDSHLLQVHPQQKFKYPIDIIFGLDDEALGPGIVLEDIESYFPSLPNGQTSSSTQGRVTKLSGCGHWSFLGDTGANALEKLLVEITAQLKRA